MIKYFSTCSEGYRSGHNEAVLKPPCHSGSNPRKSPVFVRNTRIFRTAKFFLLMFFLIQFHSSVYTEGYRSGHNEAVLKNYRSDYSKLPKTLDFIGFFALILALCEMSISQFSRNFLNFIFRYLLTFRSV